MENHVLLIDDDEDEGILLELALQQCTKQVRIHQLTQFEQVVAFADTPLLMLSLIFLDLRLPTVSGLDVLAWIRTHDRLRDVPVVVWSHMASERDIEQIHLRGGNYFLSKTTNQTAMRESIRYICETWLR